MIELDCILYGLIKGYVLCNGLILKGLYGQVPVL